MIPLEFRAEVNRQETRVMGLCYSEDCMIVAGVYFHMIPDCGRQTDKVTDRRTDGQTESIIASTALGIASYAGAL